MHIVRKMKQRRRKFGQAREMANKLAVIPQSSLPGTQALPVELWGQILDQSNWNSGLMYRQFGNIHGLLRVRLVCHLFNQEIVQGLHRTLTLGQIPLDCFLRRWNRPSLDSLPGSIFCSQLLASAIQKSVLGIRRGSRAHHHPIAYRILNCVLVARHIDKTHDLDYRRKLMNQFCEAASMSRSCWAYIFKLRYNVHAFVFAMEYYRSTAKYQDVRLEMALLVSCGYKTEEVQHCMLQLGRTGRLCGYRGDLLCRDEHCLHGGYHTDGSDHAQPIANYTIADEDEEVDELQRYIADQAATRDREADAALRELLAELEME